MTFIPASNSRIDSYNNCNYKFYRMSVKKDVKAIPNKWGEEGTRLHKAIEDYLLYETTLPTELQWLTPTLRNIKLSGFQLHIERNIAIDRMWNQVEYFASDVMYRSKADLFIVNEPQKKGALIDWKTGKIKEEPIQLERQALIEFKLNPYIDIIQANYGWLKEKKMGKPYFFHREKLEDYVKSLLTEIQKIQDSYAQDSWTKMPNRLCMYCPVHVSLGGDCNGN